MFQVFSASDSRSNEYGEGFGTYWQADSTSKTLRTSSKGVTRIPASSTMTVMFRPLVGLLQVRKYLPLQFMPLTIKLSLVDNPLDPIIFGPVIADGAAVAAANAANTFHSGSSSNSWSILNVQAKCDLVTLDNAFEEDFFH